MRAIFFRNQGLLTKLLLAGLVAVLCGCGREGGAQADKPAKPLVFVSVVPQRCFVERIGGDRVQVRVMVEAGHSPHTYEPTPRQMAELAKASTFFAVGVPFEVAWLKVLKEANPGLRIVDTREGIPLRDIDGAQEPQGHGEGEEHAEAPEHHHHHHHEGMKDPHIWLSPRLVRVQARTIAAELSRLRPQHRDEFAANLAAFEADLERVDAQIRTILQPLKQRQFMVFHPSWGYFADDYGLKQIPVEVSGREPSAKELSRLIEMAKDRNVRVLFVQRQFSSQSARAIAEAIGGRVLPLDPLAPEYLDNLLTIAQAIAGADQ